MNKEEYQLIEDCKLGDDSAKEFIYKKYAPVMLGVCLRYVNNRMQAEDIVQESFITAFEKINQLKNNSSIEWWLKKIVINNALKFLKNQQYEPDIDDINETTINLDDETGGEGVKDKILNADISQEDMLSVINSLPPGFKTVFNLYVFENYKHQEIAKELGISQGTSKSQLLRARKLIQKRLFELIKEKEKKKKKVFLSSLIITMDNNFEYIDKLAKEKLGNFTKIPLTGTEKIISATSNASKATASLGVKAKLLALVTKKIVLITSVVISTTGITYLIINNNQSDNNDKVITAPAAVKQNNDDNLKIETTGNTENTHQNSQNIQKQITTSKPNQTKQTSNKNTDVTHEVVHVKKIIKVKKKKIIIDTIRKTDTLRIKK